MFTSDYTAIDYTPAEAAAIVVPDPIVGPGADGTPAPTPGDIPPASDILYDTAATFFRPVKAPGPGRDNTWPGPGVTVNVSAQDMKVTEQAAHQIDTGTIGWYLFVDYGALNAAGIAPTTDWRATFAGNTVRVKARAINVMAANDHWKIVAEQIG